MKAGNCLKSVALFLLFSGIVSLCSYAQDHIETIDFTPKPTFVSETNTSIINLNGIWKFSEGPTSKFWKTLKTKDSQWDDIQVPGEWVMQGFEVKPNSMAAYTRDIEIPADWKKKVILLKCDGIYSISNIYCNGSLAGTHEGGFTPVQVDLSDFIRPGKKNTLVIGVQNESLADTLASATQYAAHSLGGISRKIEIFALPEVYVKSLHINTYLDESYEDARVLVDMVVANNTRKEADNIKVRFNLKEQKGPSVLFQDNNQTIVSIPAQGEQKHQFVVPVKKAKLWDPEHPNLYSTQLSLVKGDEILEKIATYIGIRDIEVLGNKVFVNGKAIKLRGVNRHEVHPTKGRSLSMVEWKSDVRLFKEANVNYIRTSHYPPGEEFIALCDSIGLFVECEAPLCWIGHGANSHWIENDPHSEDLYPLMRRMVLETIAQYRNHPSVIIWSMANESAWGPNWAKLLEEVKQVDTSRPFSFHDQAYGGFNNYGSVDSPIANIHYPGPAGPEVAWKFDRPLLFGEYAHLNTYNRREIVTDPGVRDAWGRGLESMWENMYHSTGCLGGAIWSGIDDVFYLPSGIAVGYGEWGPIDGWRRPKPEYWHLKKIYSPVKLVARDLPVPEKGKSIIKIPIENRHLFTDMSEIQINWELASASGTAEMNLLPGSTGILTIDPGFTPKEGEKLLLSFISPQGFLEDSYSLRFGNKMIEYLEEKGDIPELLVMENMVSVTMGDEVWLFDAVNGKLDNTRIGSNAIILEGPELMMLPLRTGPCNTEHSLYIEPLNDFCTNWEGSISGTGTEGAEVYIKVSGSYDEADIELVYWFGRNKGVEIDYELTVNKDIDPRQIGLVFSLAREFETLSWERVGQWSIYPDTHIGRTMGEVTPFPKGKLISHDLNQKPKGPWEADLHSMGSNDFRATRDNLYWGSLTNSNGEGIKLVSNGKGAMRAFVGRDRINFLAAGFSTAGGDLFFSSHLRNERNPLKAGDKFKSKLVIESLRK